MSDDEIGVVGPAFAAALPPHLRLLLLTDGKRISQAVHVLAELRIADQVADGPVGVDELAKRTGTDPDALGRVLRVAAGFGVFRRTPDGAYEQSEMSAVLRSGAEDGALDLVLFNGSELLWNSYGALADTVRTGRTAFGQVYGTSFFEYLAAHDDVHGLFDRAMAQMSRTTSALLLGQYEFDRFASIADVGGGQGDFLAQVLEAAPAARGTLVDLPSVAEQAERRLPGYPARDRMSVVGTDFFSGVPAGHDGYLLKAVLHDWDDAGAVRILRRIREAMGADARLLVCEFLVGEPNRWDRGALLDLDMLLRFGGRERDLDQWRVLLAEGGFALVNDPPEGRWAVLECAPA